MNCLNINSSNYANSSNSLITDCGTVCKIKFVSINYEKMGSHKN